jgi:hypothetical protein
MELGDEIPDHKQDKYALTHHDNHLLDCGVPVKFESAEHRGGKDAASFAELGRETNDAEQIDMGVVQVEVQENGTSLLNGQSTNDPKGSGTGRMAT